jgi:hypothetical protein
MPEPVNQKNNPTIRDFFNEDPTGPSETEVRESQRPVHEVGAVVLGAGKAIGEEVASHALFTGLEHLVGHVFNETAAGAVAVAGYALTGWSGTKLAHELSVEKPLERGQELGKGIVSDQARLTAAEVIEVAAPGVLPDGYVQSLSKTVNGTVFFQSKANNMAAQINVDIANGDPEAIALRDALVSGARSGLDAAYQRHIDSTAALEQLRASDPDFRRLYDGDPGFQLGVRAALWQAQTHPADFAGAEQARGVQTTTIQLARGV